MDSSQLITSALAVAGITTMIVQLLSDALIAPLMANERQRNAVLRGLNYLLNFGLLVALLRVQNAYNPADLITYASLSIGQSLLSHTNYKLVRGDNTLQAPGRPIRLRRGQTPPLADILPPAPPLPDSTTLPTVPRGPLGM